MAGGAGLATLGCTTGAPSTNPRLKVTVCGITASNRDGTDGGGDFVNWLGGKFYDGESVQVCGNHSTGIVFGNDTEQWSRSVSGNNRLNLVQGYGTFSAAVFRLFFAKDPAFGAQVYHNGFGANTLSYGTLNSAAPTANNLTTISDNGIQQAQFGTITSNNGLTYKWEPLSGSGQPWASWVNTTLSYVGASTDNTNCS
jgi:hypothetical protein